MKSNQGKTYRPRINREAWLAELERAKGNITAAAAALGSDDRHGRRLTARFDLEEHAADLRKKAGVSASGRGNPHGRTRDERDFVVLVDSPRRIVVKHDSTVSAIPDGSVAIYALIDPRDARPHYVGQSINPKKRLRQHLAGTSGAAPPGEESYQTPKRWLCELVSQGFRPSLRILEIVSRVDADQAERYWILRLRTEGEPLTNASSVSVPRQLSIVLFLDDELLAAVERIAHRLSPECPASHLAAVRAAILEAAERS